MQPINLTKVRSEFLALKAQKVSYEMGAKAPMKMPASRIHRLDCSGAFRWLMYQGSDGKTQTPDGSQNQLAWCEKELREVDYRNAARHMTSLRLFASFHKPFTNGCGPVGHVWLTAMIDVKDNGTLAGSMESHFGRGINSRPWNYPSLLEHVYKCFEIPTLEGMRS